MFNEERLNEVKKQIEEDIKNNQTVLFMKGNKEMPQCGFSAQVVQILNQSGNDYITRDVLEDDHLRQAIKEYSDWPTIPQLYVNQKFIGGCDIVMELHRTGELDKIFS